MQIPMPRVQTRSTGRKPSPRFASVVGHAQMRAPACASRSSSAPSACVACTTVVRSERQPVRSSSSIGRMPCSARHSSISRGCSSACTCSGKLLGGGVAADLLEPVGRARAHGVGSDPDGDPASRAGPRPGRRYSRDGLLPEARQTSASVRGEQDDDPDARPLRPPRPPPEPRRSPGSGTRRPRCSRSRRARGRPRRTPGARARASGAPPRPASAPASPRSPHPLLRPRRARWKAWQWAFTNPGRLRGLGHGRILSHTDGHPRGSRPVAAASECADDRAARPDPGLRRPDARPPRAATAGRRGSSSASPAITDQIDGYLARRWHVESDFGRIFDPLADRLMIDAAVILLFVADHMPLAGLIVILGRDLAPHAGLQGDRAAGLPAEGELPRQGGDVAAVRGDRVPASSRPARPTGPTGSSGRASRCR